MSSLNGNSPSHENLEVEGLLSIRTSAATSSSLIHNNNVSQTSNNVHHQVNGVSTFHPPPKRPSSLAFTKDTNLDDLSSGIVCRNNCITNGAHSSSSSCSSSFSAIVPKIAPSELIASIPPFTPTPTSTTSGIMMGHQPIMTQIHDGFATVRKRKGPSRASIALQQQEFYDLAAQSPHKQRNQKSMSVGSTPVGPGPNNTPFLTRNTGTKTTKMKNHSNELQSSTMTHCNCISSSLSNINSNNKGTAGDSWLSGNGICDITNSNNINLKPNRLKPSSSLRHKIRRLVLPNKMQPPSSSLNGNSGSLKHSHSLVHSQQHHGFPFYHSTLSNISNSNSTPNCARLPTSFSDNSIVTCCNNGTGPSVAGAGAIQHYQYPYNNRVVNTLPGDFTFNYAQSNVTRQYHHRSCFLPKPPLEPVLEDNNHVARRPRKDIPWWELATRKHRYRSCPILQVTQQAHVVAAFEQSLSNMTHRLQSLTLTAEQKDTELIELRQTIELLRKQSIEAGLTVANFQSVSSRDGSPIARQLSADSVSSINSISSACSGTSHSHTSSPSGKVQMTPSGTPTHGGNLNTTPDSPNSIKKHSKNKGWLRSSFTKAFSRSKSKARNGSINNDYSTNFDEIQHQRISCVNGGVHTHEGAFIHNGGNNNSSPHHQQLLGKHNDSSGPLLSPLLTSPRHINGGSCSAGCTHYNCNGLVKGSSSSSALCEDFEDKHKSVDDLKKQLREKEMVLTDIRLEALTSAHQLESMKETVTKMRNEMLSLKQDNDRLQRLVTCKSLTSSQSSLQPNELESFDRRLSATEIPASSSIDILLADPTEKDGKHIILTVFLGCHGSIERYINSSEGFPTSECSIGSISVNNRTKWDLLDSLVKRTFKDYITRIDPLTSLGISTDSIDCYCVGEVVRSKDNHVPELLPCGYLVGDVNKIRICLKGALSSGSIDALAFETLISKSILQRYVAWLTDQGRLMLCGPSGTGKSYLARKLGEYLTAMSGKEPCPEAIATFSADHKNTKELKQYLGNLADQCESGSADLPSVIILDNLHQVASFAEVFSKFLPSKHASSSMPLIIGTMSQPNSSTTNNVQMNCNFRCVLLRNHAEPVKGLLSRYLQRRLIEADVQSGTRNLELSRVVEWIPEVWHHINKFLERHASSDATIGPRLLLSCPTDVANSQVWFTDLWHYSIVPYLIEAVKEGVQIYGKKNVPWEDPSQFLLQTYPWNESASLSTTKASLLRIRPEDVGYDTKSGSNFVVLSKANKSDGIEPDPLMSMLMRLQEAANYSGAQSNDSDTTSLDSHTSLDSSKEFTATA